MPTPPEFDWLDKVGPLPRMVAEALKLYGTHEGVGSVDNPTILAWAKEVGLEKVYTHDSIPWCGLFMALIAKRSGKPSATSPLWALSWANWGNPGGQPRLGDVLVFKRLGGGHVGLYVGEGKTNFYVLGGNEGDRVNIVPISKDRLYAVRRYYAVGMPESAKPYLLDYRGMPLSTDEA